MTLLAPIHIKIVTKDYGSRLPTLLCNKSVNNLRVSFELTYI